MLPLGHTGPPQYWIFTSAQGKNILLFWNLLFWMPEREPQDPMKQAFYVTTALAPTSLEWSNETIVNASPGMTGCMYTHLLSVVTSWSPVVTH